MQSERKAQQAKDLAEAELLRRPAAARTEIAAPRRAAASTENGFVFSDDRIAAPSTAVNVTEPAPGQEYDLYKPMHSVIPFSTSR
jgi:hypothetical protein